jgi:hypothetical protein
MDPPPPSNDPQALEKWNQARREESDALAAVTRAAAQARAEENARDNARPIYSTIEVSLPFHFELADADQSPFTPVTDEKLRAEVEGSLSVDKVFVGDRQVFLAIGSRDIRTDLSFAVILRDGQNEWPINGGFVRDRTGEMRLDSYPVFGVLQGNGPTGPTVDVVLRPDPNEATNDRNFPFVGRMTTYWGREVVLKNVPVRPASENPYFEGMQRGHSSLLATPSRASANLTVSGLPAPRPEKTAAKPSK